MGGRDDCRVYEIDRAPVGYDKSSVQVLKATLACDDAIRNLYHSLGEETPSMAPKLTLSDYCTLAFVRALWQILLQSILYNQLQDP